MQTPYKKGITFDLETSGFSTIYNSITEIAMVAIDMEKLSIVDEFSVLLKPRLDLNWRTDESIKDAKIIFKNISEKDEDSGIKTIKYKGKKITLKNVSDLEDDIDGFRKLLDSAYKDNFIKSEEIKELLNSEYKDVFELYLSNAYNKEAEKVSGISLDLLFKDGLELEDAFSMVLKFMESHTHGNSKPIMIGHNIGSLPRRIVKGKEVKPDGFDNPFMEKFFAQNKDDYFYRINDLIIDTLKEAKLKWFELPSYNLGTCCNEVGITLKEAHRALPDTISNAKLFIKMTKSLRGDGSSNTKKPRRKFSANF